MKTCKTIAAVAALFITASTYASSTDDIVKNISSVMQGMKIEQVILSPETGLYEVITPNGIFYTDKTGAYVIFGGTLVDSKTKTNLTAKRTDILGAFDFANLPLADAIKTVKGDGSRVMATFEDPNCGYCKKLMPEFAKLDNVTIYTFLLPILSPDSKTKSQDIWCSPNPSKVWNSFMAANTAIPTASQCETPLERNLALAKKMRIMGTPAILFSSNVKVPGYLVAADIETRLAVKSK